jgi:hypothetical protein
MLDSMMPRSILRCVLIVFFAAFSLRGVAKKVNPDDYTIAATVKSTDSHELTSSFHSAPRPAFCANPQAGFQTGFCATYVPSVSTRTYMVYTVLVDIGSTEYELRSTSFIGTGVYKARLMYARGALSLGILFSDRKGRPVGYEFPIVGEHPQSETKLLAEPKIRNAQRSELNAETWAKCIRPLATPSNASVGADGLRNSRKS